MISNINTGVCAARIQQGLPPYFVNWDEDGESKYEFFVQIFARCKFKARLEAIGSIQAKDELQQNRIKGIN